MTEVSEGFPFRSEYAKSSRAACKTCKTTIEKGELRLAVMVQSPMFDGKTPHWYHVKCFFLRSRPKTVGDFSYFDSLRWEDQEKIRELVEKSLAGKGPSASREKGSSGVSSSGTILKDFRVEYAKSGAAKCKVCEEKIKKQEVRISKKEYNSQRAKMYGPYDAWHHVKCFVEKREELEYFDSAEKLSGFMTLSKDDQDMLKNSLKKMKRKVEGGKDEPDSKKIKKDPEEEKQREEIKKQMKKLYYYRDYLQKLKKKELETLLEYNHQDIPSGVDTCLDRIADGMTFGALERCPECKNGQLVFRSGIGYQCVGDISEWTKCIYNTKGPKRREFVIPPEFKEEFSWMNIYQSKPHKRIIPNTASSVKNGGTGSSSSGGLKSGKPLKDLKFVLEGKIDKGALKKQIESFGGKVEKNVKEKTAAVISDSASINSKKSKIISSAEALGIQVIPSEALDKAMKEDIVSLIKNNSICEWGLDPKERLASVLLSNGSDKGSSSKSMEMPKSMKYKLKGGAYVDPDSGMEDKCHIYKRGDVLYTAVLGAVSIQDSKNSYYKLQVLKHDKKSGRYYVFRSWGRVGTAIGGTKLEDFENSSDAVREFERLYEEKTGNLWKKRAEFTKIPGKFYPLDIDYGQSNDEIKKLELSNSKSKLPKPVQELICLIFDIENMKKAMVEFEIDLNKMPLGKLSRKQIQTAYKILTEVQTMVKDNSGSQTKFLDASNRFFTLIPHDFGLNSPPLLDNLDYIKTKIDMLDNLLEIEIAYNLLKAESTEDDKSESQDPFDVHYKKLKTEIDVLDRESMEFKILEKYVRNTHAETHNLYTLEIEHIMKINRKNEAKRYRPFKKLPNRRLLWHGSRITNFAGILSQGLRIAPSEAPVTGYMFGKGIYFADMVSKSANYCCTSRKNNTGLLLLCDVALGNIYERTHADYIEKLPTGKHSTKGVGKTEPDPKETTEIDGAIVPYGKPVKAEVEKSDLLYNEYIVYDVAQLQCKYLFRLKFNYKI